MEEGRRMLDASACAWTRLRVFGFFAGFGGKRCFGGMISYLVKPFDSAQDKLRSVSRIA